MKFFMLYGMPNRRKLLRAKLKASSLSSYNRMLMAGQLMEDRMGEERNTTPFHMNVCRVRLAWILGMLIEVLTFLFYASKYFKLIRKLSKLETLEKEMLPKIDNRAQALVLQLFRLSFTEIHSCEISDFAGATCRLRFMTSSGASLNVRWSLLFLFD